MSNTIGQLAYHNALQHGCKSIYFAGNFLRHQNTIGMRTLAYAIDYWSKNSMEGLFLRHEGYCGAFGAFLNAFEPQQEAALAAAVAANAASVAAAGGGGGDDSNAAGSAHNGGGSS